MSTEPPRAGALASLLDRADGLLQSPATKLVLSFLIVVSVLPPGALTAAWSPAAAEALDLVFLAVFAPEFALRTAAYVRQLRSGRATGWEPVVLLADLVALVSFLPLRGMFPSTAYFRLFRLTRMVLLLGYWGDMVADLWRILSGSERRYQVVFVFSLGLVLSFAGAVILAEFAPAFDYNADGQADARDQGFRHVLWWSFRQVQDPGNLAADPRDAVVVAISLVLTFAGLLLLSFVIGISTGAMDELMRRTRDRPVGLRGHTVILGLGPYTVFLLEELADIYAKNRRRVRAAVLGPTADPPAYFHSRRLKAFRYRRGDPVRARDLERVDVDRAKRILVLGTGDEESDARVISAVLAARGRNPGATLFADLEREKNFVAARAAGGPRTQVVGSGPFLGYYVAQNLIFPGVHRAYRQMLTSSGCEIYTYLFDPGERRRLAAVQGESLAPLALFEAAHLRHRVALLGFFVGEGEPPAVLLNPFSPGVRGRSAESFDPGGSLRVATIRGLVGVAVQFEHLRDLARSLLGSRLQEPPSAPPPLGLELAVPGGELRRVVICGGSARIPRVVSELMRTFESLEITILVREEPLRAVIEESVRAALEGYLAGLPGPEHVTPRGRSWRVLHADWSDVTTLVRSPAVDLGRTDAMLFLPRDPSDVNDGLVALDCLRLAEFGARGVVSFRPGFRVVALVRDPVKSDLLESRLDQLAGAGLEARFSVVSSERLRNHFLVQNLFVRELNAVLLEILEASGQQLCRLLAQAPGGGPLQGEFDPWELARGLVAEHAVVPVGIELRAPPGPGAVVLDPAQRSPGQRMRWEDVAALYVLAEGARIRASTPS